MKTDFVCGRMRDFLIRYRESFPLNPNTPVIIGISQVLQRTTDPEVSDEPVDMMVNAVWAAAADAGNEKMLTAIESVRVIRGVWRYEQPASYIAQQIGATGAETFGTAFGGNAVQSMVNLTALEILDGKKSLVLLTGAENGNSMAKARKAGFKLSYRELPGTYDRLLGKDESMAGEAELARGIRRATEVYPIFENAIRYQRGETIDQHRDRISALWAGFSQVAADNPSAWIREPVEASVIRTASAKNRMVSFPYPKLMNSNNAVDMASALIMCSVEKARALNIPESKWVYPWCGTDAHDHYLVSSRDNLYSSPAIRFAGRRAMELVSLSPDDLDFVDIYSCFPSAVQVSAGELGLSFDRPLTVTGGLTFGGGPLNNYVMHSIARMVELNRENPGKVGLITANGGYLSKHAFGIYSSQPPEKDFQYADLQADVDKTPSREWLIDYDGEVDIESYTVMFGPDGASMGHAACLTDDGKRTWANTEDMDMLTEMTQTEFCGRRARINGAGVLSID
jgi:acetyl-CoA C-acetyltransferase